MSKRHYLHLYKKGPVDIDETMIPCVSQGNEVSNNNNKSLISANDHLTEKWVEAQGHPITLGIGIWS